ncbi:unnamed protein product [Ixodes pacificus]
MASASTRTLRLKMEVPSPAKSLVNHEHALLSSQPL